MLDEEFDPSFDAYAILGVPKNATKEQVSKAFRSIARDNHPDTHPGDKDCVARFKEAQKAYKILSDPERRARYDSVGNQVGRTVTKVTRDPRVQEILDRARGKGNGGRPPAGTPQRPPARERPERTTNPSTTAGRAASRDGQTAPPPPRARERAPESMPRGADVAEMRRIVFEGAERIRVAADGDIRDRDKVTLDDGTTYTFRRVNFTKEGDRNVYRTRTPLLCRGDEVLANINLAPGQGLKPASAATCKQFASKEQDVVGQAVLALVTQRAVVAPIARELRSLMPPEEQILFVGMPIHVRNVEFIGGKGPELVLCADNEILELRDTDPVDPRLRFADTSTAKNVSGNYLALRSIAAAQARTKGRAVPSMSADRLGNTARAAGERLLGWLGD